jgi:SAM-dependent methyltransferase
MVAPKDNFAAAQAFVEFGLREKQHGRRESASGPGSAQSAAGDCLALLDAVVEEYSIGSILDLGCGDWNWMQLAAWRKSAAVRYEGWDAHAGLVESLTETFGNERTQFRLADLTTAPLPPADLVVCRDVLFHLPVELVERVVGRLRDHGSLLISTSFLEVESNTDIHTYLPIENWVFYYINLDIAPFNLRPFRVRTIRETACGDPGRERSVCLYDFRGRA